MDEKNRPVTRAIYNVLALSSDGRKELLGMYISKSEGANFWLSILTDLQSRGVRDILIACVDGLKGFPDAIASVFPDTTVQLCIVHQIRNSIKYVACKNQKAFMKDLKLVYQAVNKEAAENALKALEDKWGEDYPIVIKSWRDNWEHLSAYFQYTEHIRRIIYTTNTVEGYHRQLRKVTKNKGVFTIRHWRNLSIWRLQESEKSGLSQHRTGGRRHNSWLSSSPTGSEFWLNLKIHNIRG